MAEITTTEFAAELETDTRTVRKFLRSITPKEAQPGKGARWSIDGNKRSLNQMRKTFAEWSEAQNRAKDEPTADEVEDIDDEGPTEEELDGIDEN